jgi:phage terminase large subunit-like protein
MPQSPLSTPVHRNQAFVQAALEWLHEPSTTMEQALAFYETTYAMPGCDDWTIAALGRGDRFFLGVHLCGRVDLIHPWLYARFREVEAAKDGFLDLWFREGYKSTVITFLGSIQEVLNDPEITICVFSHTKGIAKKFLLQIKQELETNERLKALYPEILYQNPSKDSPKWTEEALTVKRTKNPKECSIECSGLVDGMPTGAHFALRIYDDVVVPASIGTPDQVAKTTDAFDLSDNLGARGPDGTSRKQGAGTRYAFFDPYSTIIERGVLNPRIHPATDNGLVNGKPVFFSEAVWAQKKIDQPPKILACQMLQNPAAGNESMFKREWLSFQDVRPSTLNVYIVGDPANSKKKGSDNTAIAVIGIDAANNKYLLDGFRHKMGLKERWEALRGLRKVWSAQPGVQMVKVGYERYGLQSDLEYFEEQMLLTKDHFEIAEVNWVKEGGQSKIDRIQRLTPDFQARKFHLAMVCTRDDGTGNKVPYETANQKKVRESGQAFRVFSPVRRRDHEGHVYSLNKGLLDEYLTFPFSAHDDLLDACSRIYDLEPVPPIVIDQRALEPEAFEDGA